MKICIFYDSLTGNTKTIAQSIEKALGDEVIYCGKPAAIDADLYFIGSWTDKGQSTSLIQNTLSNMSNAKVAYFTTCGFGQSQDYYDALIQRAKQFLNSNNTFLGAFVCQGKMPLSVKERYISLLREHPEDKKLQVSLDNFELALSHPDTKDIENAKKWAQEMRNAA